MFSSATRANAPLAPPSQIFLNVWPALAACRRPQGLIDPCIPGVADFEARQLFGIGIGLATAPQ
jgi:hypothetical protein